MSWILPKIIDNTYTAPKWTLGIFGAVTAITLWRSIHHIVAPDGGAQSIATIPLDQFSSDGSAAVIGMFALWGLSQLLVGLVFLVVLIRYRRLIPLMWVLVLMEYSMRIVIGQFKPIPTVGTAPGAMGNVPFVILAVIMLLIGYRSFAQSKKTTL